MVKKFFFSTLYVILSGTMYITYISSVCVNKPYIHFITTLTPTVRQNNVMVKKIFFQSVYVFSGKCTVTDTLHIQLPEKNFFLVSVCVLSGQCISPTYQVYV